MGMVMNMGMVMDIAMCMVTGIDMLVWSWVRVGVRVIPINAVDVTIHPITITNPA